MLSEAEIYMLVVAGAISLVTVGCAAYHTYQRHRQFNRSIAMITREIERVDDCNLQIRSTLDEHKKMMIENQIIHREQLEQFAEIVKTNHSESNVIQAHLSKNYSTFFQVVDIKNNVASVAESINDTVYDATPSMVEDEIAANISLQSQLLSDQVSDELAVRQYLDIESHSKMRRK